MTKKHFTEFANILYEARNLSADWEGYSADKSDAADQIIDIIEDKLIAYLSWDNNNFDVVKFFKASGREV